VYARWDTGVSHLFPDDAPQSGGLGMATAL
jgi:hypothetical protein